MTIKLHQQKGFTLAEIMIASALGIIVLIGMVQIFQSVKQGYNLQLAMNQIQENGRFAVHFLNQKIRMAGYSQCLPHGAAKTKAIMGYSANTAPAYPNIHPRQSSDILLISQCQAINNKEEYFQTAYFISTTRYKNKNHQLVLALFEKRAGKQRRELVANIEDMKIQYGIESQDKKFIDRYVSADQVIDWKKVRSVAISLLLNSEDTIFPKDEKYQFNGKVIGADKRLHKQWKTYVAVRERI